MSLSQNIDSTCVTIVGDRNADVLYLRVVLYLNVVWLSNINKNEETQSKFPCSEFASQLINGFWESNPAISVGVTGSEEIMLTYVTVDETDEEDVM